jgi:hypothetical protein
LTTSLLFKEPTRKRFFGLGDHIDNKAKPIHNAFGRYTILFENSCLHDVKKDSPILFMTFRFIDQVSQQKE